MRVTALVLATACLGLPARAGEPRLMEDYATATQSFMGGLVDNRQWTETYRNHVFATIAGTWLPMSLVQPGSLDDVKKFCQTAGNKITPLSQYSFTMNRRFSKDLSLDYTYNYVAANTFSEYVDVGKLIEMLRLDNQQMSSARLGILGSANGHLTIFRPTEDILVMQYNQKPPIIYGRCP